MGKADAACYSTQLIAECGTFNVAGVESFLKEVKLAECGNNYVVVSIMGPQSSGKSTLLNHLFNTNFKEMDAVAGRSQTTKGIWMALCPGIDPCTIVLDLEGTDGVERAQDDDIAFEKQSALFALAVSDIVLINMWCHDVGREVGANRPLLKNVFQVMMRLCSPRKTTLMFVIRDQTKTSLETLEAILRKDIQKIWDSVPKPQAHKETPLSAFFNVEVVALSNFEEKEEKFKEQVANLRQRFSGSISPGGLAGDRQSVVPASGFSVSAQKFWTDIKANKDLDLPAHKVMVATVRCDQIANEKYTAFTSDKEWRGLKDAVQSGPVPGFGKKLSSILDTYLSKYDTDTTYFEDNVRTAKRKLLEEKLLQLVQAAYQLMLGHIVSGALQKFKYDVDRALNGGQGFVVAARDFTAMFMKYFDEECADAVIKQANWDTTRVRDKLHRDIDAHVTSVCTAKISELAILYESKLKEAISGPVEPLLDGASDDTWPAIRKLLRRETETAVAGCSAALSCFEIDEDAKEIVLSRLEDFARGVVESKAKEESGRVLIRMKYRFTDSMLRFWTGKEDLRAITKTALSSSLKFLSVLAAIRLDDDADNIWDTLALALLDSNSVTSRSIASVDPLASSTWEQVPATKTLLTPVQCKNLWRQFQSETEYIVTQASAAKVIVATVRCEEIADEKCSAFIADEEWRGLKDAVQSGPVPGFGKKLSSILDTYLSKYDTDTTYFEDNVRTAKRKLLEEKLLQIVQPAYHSMLGHIRSGALDKFKDAFGRALNGGQDFEVASRDCTAMFMKYFDEECAEAVVKQANWDTARVRDKLNGDISAHVASVCTAKLAEVTTLYESKLKEAVSGPVDALLDGASDDTWPDVLSRETERAVADFSAELNGFGLNKDTKKTWISRFKDFGYNVQLLLIHTTAWFKRCWTSLRGPISEVVLGFLHRVKAWFTGASTSVLESIFEMAVTFLLRRARRALSLPPAPMHS